jgi:hypothetical protein
MSAPCIREADLGPANAIVCFVPQADGGNRMQSGMEDARRSPPDLLSYREIDRIIA